MTVILAAGLAGVACWLFLSVPRLRRLLPIRSDRRWRRKETALSIAAGALTAVVFDGWWAVIAGVGVAAAVYVLSRRRSDPEKSQLLVQQLPDVLGFLAVVLESGAPLPMAVRVVAEVSPEPSRTLLHGLAASSGLGMDETEVWTSLTEHPVWGRVARDVARSARSGTTLVEVLRMHAEEARQIARDGAVKAARSVGVKSVLPLVVCFLPAFVLVGVIPIIVGLLRGLTG